MEKVTPFEDEVSRGCFVTDWRKLLEKATNLYEKAHFISLHHEKAPKRFIGP